MSHVDAGPLANYNSLLDPHLSGYFSTTRIKKHLRKAGLVTRGGAVVTENEFRVRMARKEHRRQVRDMLASAIVNNTLDMERRRQVLIRRKLEEIASIELVKRVKAHRKFGYEAAIEDMVKLNLLGDSRKASDQSLTGEEAPSESQLPQLGPVQLDSVQWSQKKLVRPSSGPPQATASLTPGASRRDIIRVPRPQSGPTTNNAGGSYQQGSDVTDDDDDAETEHLWSRSAAWSAADKARSSERPQTSMKLPVGQQAWRSDSSLAPQSPPNGLRSDRSSTAAATRPRSHLVDRQLSGEGGVSSRDLDYRYLSTLDRAATEKYGLLLDKDEAGRHESPYIENAELLAPRPPTSQRHDSVASSGRRRSAAGPAAGRGSANIPRDEHGHPIRCPKRSKGTLMLHRAEPAFKIQDQVQTFCEIVMRYFGSHISLERDGVDPRHQILVEQQHCGGSTLAVFKELLLPKSDFTFTSRRHSGYPFSLTFYIDGIQDIRLSACCEYKHRKGYRLGGKTGHFGFVRISGSVPCYRCEVERDARIKAKSRRRAEKKNSVSNAASTAVDTAVANDLPLEPVTEPDQKPSNEAPSQEYNDDFDVEDDATAKPSSSRRSSIEKPDVDDIVAEHAPDDSADKADSEHGVMTYEDDFEAANLDDNIEKHAKSDPLEIAVADDSDEEERRMSKDKYQPPKVVRAVNIPMPDPDRAQLEQSAHAGEVISSDWLMTVNVSKKVVQKPPAAKPPQSSNDDRHGKSHNSSSSGGSTEKHPEVAAADSDGRRQSEDIMSDDESDLFGMTESSASSPPPSGRQSPVPPAARDNDADDIASVGLLDEGRQQASASPGRSERASLPSSGRSAPPQLPIYDGVRASSEPGLSDRDDVESVQSDLDGRSSVRRKAPERPAADSNSASEIEDDYELPIPREKPRTPTHAADGEPSAAHTHSIGSGNLNSMMALSSRVTSSDNHSLVPHSADAAAAAMAADAGTGVDGNTVSQDDQQAVAASTAGPQTQQLEQHDQQEQSDQKQKQPDLKQERPDQKQEQQKQKDQKLEQHDRTLKQWEQQEQQHQEEREPQKHPEHEHDEEQGDDKNAVEDDQSSISSSSSSLTSSFSETTDSEQDQGNAAGGPEADDNQTEERQTAEVKRA